MTTNRRAVMTRRKDKASAGMVGGHRPKYPAVIRVLRNYGPWALGTFLYLKEWAVHVREPVDQEENMNIRDNSSAQTCF